MVDFKYFNLILILSRNLLFYIFYLNINIYIMEPERFQFLFSLQFLIENLQ